MKEVASRLVQWIRENTVGAGGVVFGLSGGLDSSVLGVLCKQAFPRSTLGVIMPCHSNPVDEEHALLVARKFEIDYRKVALDGTFDALVAALPDDGPEATRHMAQANLKPRLRMTVLYHLANRLGRIVVGSGDRSELCLGYFTKYGDGGADILPLGNLLKTQVRQLGAWLGVPDEILGKPPSPGLWAGQTAEGELGLSYDEVDRCLLGGAAPETTRQKVNGLMLASWHKRSLPPIPSF